MFRQALSASRSRFCRLDRRVLLTLLWLEEFSILLTHVISRNNDNSTIHKARKSCRVLSSHTTRQLENAARLRCSTHALSLLLLYASQDEPCKNVVVRKKGNVLRTSLSIQTKPHRCRRLAWCSQRIHRPSLVHASWGEAPYVHTAPLLAFHTLASDMPHELHVLLPPHSHLNMSPSFHCYQWSSQWSNWTKCWTSVETPVWPNFVVSKSGNLCGAGSAFLDRS